MRYDTESDVAARKGLSVCLGVLLAYCIISGMRRSPVSGPAGRYHRLLH